MEEIGKIFSPNPKIYFSTEIVFHNALYLH